MGTVPKYLCKSLEVKMDLLRTDIEIAQSVEMEPITKVADRAGIDED